VYSMKKSVLVLVLSLASFSATAKNLYVNNSSASCNDQTTYAANDASNPWCTLQRAASGADSWANMNTTEAAKAGDTVLVNAGSYTTAGSGSRLHPAYEPANSGNATDGFITFEAQGNVRLNTTDSAPGSVIGAYLRNYIKWKGFTIDESTAPYRPDTGPITIFSADNVIIENCVVRASPSAIQDNHTGIRFENATNSVARGNVIHGLTGSVPETSTAHNYAGIMLYGNSDILIENNHVFDSNAGIFIKGNNNYNITVRYNLIHDTRKGIRTTYTHPTLGHSYIYQNIIRDGVGDSNMGINIAEYSNNVTYANNTIDNFQNGIYFSNSTNQSNLIIRNNIISNTNNALNAWSVGDKAFTLDYNVYFNTNEWAFLGAIQTSITSWKSAVSDDANADLHDPQFENANNNNFRLGSGSLSNAFAIDFLDLDGDSNTTEAVNAGAYTSSSDFIGSPLSVSIPSSPTNLRVLQ